MCEHNGIPDTYSHVKTMQLGVEIGERVWGVPASPIGMYRCILTVGYDDKGEPDISTGIEEDINACAKCLFLEDDPNNWGEIINPTTYDGDCDVCGYVSYHEIECEQCYEERRFRLDGHECNKKEDE